MTMHTPPVAVTTSVLTAVAEGAWSADDVTATVTAEVRADRADVIATLWDLVADGSLTYTPGPKLAFRIPPTPKEVSTTC